MDRILQGVFLFLTIIIMLISNDTNRGTFVFRDVSYSDDQNVVKIKHYKEGKKMNLRKCY